MSELPETIGVEDLARLLDLSPRRVQQLADQGIIQRPKHGRYALVSAVQSYLRQRLESETAKPQTKRAAIDKIRAKREALKLAAEERELFADVLVHLCGFAQDAGQRDAISYCRTDTGKPSALFRAERGSRRTGVGDTRTEPATERHRRVARSSNDLCARRDSPPASRAMEALRALYD